MLWRDEENKLPIFIEDGSGDPATGLAFGDVSLRYTRPGDSSMETFAPDVDQWSERGLGFYALTLPAALIDEEGLFAWALELAMTGMPTPRGIAQTMRRFEERFLEAEFSGYSEGMVGRAIEDAADPEHFLEAPGTGYAEGTVGALLEAAGTPRYEVFASPSYNHEAGVLRVRVWIHRDGLMIANPEACEAVIKNEAGVTIFDLTSSSPDADGFFLLEANPQDPLLTSNHNYSVVAKATVGGTEYSSGEGYFTLN